MTTTSSSSSSSSFEILHLEMTATWQWRIETDPELAASLGLLWHRTSRHALDPRSPSSCEQRVAWLQRALTRIQTAVQREELSDSQQISYDLYVQQLTDYVTFTPLHKAYLCCVNRLEGPQTDLPLYAKYLPVNTKDDCLFYMKFLKAVPVQLEEVTTLLRMGMEEKRTPPAVSLKGVVEQIRGMVEDGLTAFSDPLHNFPKDATELQNECQQMIDTDVSRAFTAFANFLEDDYVPNLRTEISAVEGYPNGAQYYKDCLAFHTTTEMTPQEVHQLGLEEVQRVRDNMEAIAAQAGYAGRLDDYLEYLRSSPKFEPSSGQALCARFRDITGRIVPALLKLFHLHTLPRMPFAIVETPAAHAAMAPAAYYLAGSADPKSPRPGMFYVNTSELSTRRTYECEALALHEAIPGHHTQAAIQAESTDLPAFRRYQEDRRYFEAPCRFPFYTAYIEGWGLHSETLGVELGLYQHPEDKMGQLSMEALRSCRLVVDTGMHALGWSRERALQYMLDNTAMGRHDAATEVDRYLTWPGQATGYKTGERFFHKLRKKAEEELADAFDPRDFYEVVLQCGPVPLGMLEKLVQRYIDTKKSSALKNASAKMQTADKDVSSDEVAFVESMTFANWCKCCVVPGSCRVSE